MNSKQTNIAILLVVVAIALFVIFEFFGLGGFFSSNSEAPASDAQAVLNEVRQTGTVSGLKAVTLAAGSGEAAVAGDTVSVNYTGLLPDGTVFDASANYGQAFTFTLGAGEVIKGWEEGIVGMTVGEKRLLAIPPDKAYGSQQYGPIPANSTLIFEVELVSITKPGS